MRRDDGCCPLCGQPKRVQRNHQFGDVTVADGEIRKGGLSIPLSPVRYALVEALAARANKPVSIESLMQLVYGHSDDPPSENTINVHLSNIRRIIGVAAIESRFGGYRIFRPEKVDLNPDAVPGVPVPRHNAWLPEHDAMLRDLFERGLDDKAIAEQLGRGEPAVQFHRLSLGLRHDRQDRWTPDQDAVLGRLKSPKDAALVLGRSVAAIKARRQVLRRKSA